MKDDQAVKYRKLAEEYGIYLSIHAPYYISLASKNKEVVERSKQEVVKGFKLAGLLDATRIIFHPGGGYGKGEAERKAGLQQLIDALNEVGKQLDTSRIRIYPEIGGKVNQLGSLDEIIEICKQVKYARPCLDLAHLHARENGSLKSKESIVKALKKVETELGRTALEETHFHMYPVSYGAGGEQAHKTFAERIETSQINLFESDDRYYPRAEDYIAAIKELKLSPVTICEAHNTQDVGAMLMKEFWEHGI
ncbi:MAG: TIM barrel protein [Firmicutes bacterium]|nr:TIM barrel protein [Bacillota bacterium]